MTKEAIIDEIELRTSSKYSTWRIGLTNDPDQRRLGCEGDGEKIVFWMDWRTDSPADAREIELSFINRGMKRAAATKLQPHKDMFIFIF